MGSTGVDRGMAERVFTAFDADGSETIELGEWTKAFEQQQKAAAKRPGVGPTAEASLEPSSPSNAPPSPGLSAPATAPVASVPESSQVRAIRIWLHLVDTCGKPADGTIERSELYAHLRATAGVDEDTAARVFAALDVNCDGQIELAEWLRAYSSPAPAAGDGRKPPETTGKYPP